MNKKIIAIVVMLMFVCVATISAQIIREHYDFNETTFNQLAEYGGDGAIMAPGVWKYGTVGMSFTPQKTHYINKIVLRVCKSGDPGIITLRLRALPPLITEREFAWTNLNGAYANCADGSWYTSHALFEWVPPFTTGYANYTLPAFVRQVTWYCKDDVGRYQYTFPQSSIDGSLWINITMMYEPGGDGYMYTYRTKNTGNTAMPGAGGDRWSPVNNFYEEKLSFTRDMNEDGYLITEDDWREYDIVLLNLNTSAIQTWNDPMNNWNDWTTWTITFPKYRLQMGTTYLFTFSKNKEFTPSDGLYFLSCSYWNPEIEQIYPHYTRGALYLTGGSFPGNENNWWYLQNNYMWFQEYQP